MRVCLEPNEKGRQHGEDVGYARVSSDGQNVASLKAKLEMLGAVAVFNVTGNGSSLDVRGQFEAVIRLLDRGDELGVLYPDRLARVPATC